MENATMKLPRACFTEDRCGAGGRSQRRLISTPGKQLRGSAATPPPAPCPLVKLPLQPAAPRQGPRWPREHPLCGPEEGVLHSPVTPLLMGWADLLTEAKMSTQVALGPGLAPTLQR